MLSLILLAVAFSTALYVQAAPAPETVAKRQSITTLSSSEISAFRPFSFFASVAYCNPSTTATWTCRPRCDGNPDFVPAASGGDGNSVQFWYVGFSPSEGSVIVAHQGTDPSQILAVATDVDLLQLPLDPTLFPGIPSSVLVHMGFADEQARTANEILAAVNTTIAAHSATKVTVVGHSLGAALAVLDSVFLPLTSAVGNQAFANYVDSHLTLTHINNKEDPVPIVPSIIAGYHHPSGEVHIMDSGAWVSCPGQDNPSTECIVGDVPNLLVSNENDHDGPYDGVEMGTGC